MTTRPSDAARLLQILNSETEAVSLFVVVLKKEQKALAQGDTDALPALVEEKNVLGGQLATLATQRNVLLAGLGLAGDRPGVEAWCAGHPEEKVVAAAWAGVLELAREAKELNRLNGELIALRMQHNARALEALRSGNNPLDLYGPDGQAQPPNRVRINDSV